MSLKEYHKNIGNTDIKVSPLGLGTVKLGRNEGVKYPNDFCLPNDRSIRNLLAYARDLGINILDTAPAYGTSEERLGHLLDNRKDWVITGKAGEYFSNNRSSFDFKKSSIIASVNQSLKRLKTDYLDILLIHSNGDDEKIINDYDVFETLNLLKKQGKIRASGMSTKTITGGMLTIDNSDVAMITYNPSHTEELPIIEHAKEKNKGILIKKALASGHLDKIGSNNPVQDSLKFIFSKEPVNSIIVGTINITHLEQNVASAIKVLESNHAK